MTTLKRANSNRIYFFDQNDQNQFFQNTLKEFIYFLKFKGVHSNIDFSYSHFDDTLHCHLSIKDNFILDSIPTSLIKDSEINLVEFIKSLQNHHLKELIFKLGDLKQPISQLSKEQKKLTSIIKVILSQSQYLFLDNPDELISKEDLDQVKKCIRYEVKNNNRIVLIKSKRKILWPEIVTNIVSKDENRNYVDSPNPLFENEPEHKTSHSYSFTLNKKVS